MFYSSSSNLIKSRIPTGGGLIAKPLKKAKILYEINLEPNEQRYVNWKLTKNNKGMYPIYIIEDEKAQENALGRFNGIWEIAIDNEAFNILYTDIYRGLEGRPYEYPSHG